jgi:hypothetical protein
MDPDQTSIGGAPPTQPGYGPNTRTIMQFRVSNVAATSFNLAALQTAFASTGTTTGVFATDQDPIIVPQAPYDSAYNASYPSDTRAYARIQDTTMTFTPIGAASARTFNLQPKAIQELFDPYYGRMNATLGVELPNTTGTNQTTIPFFYIDPPTEIVKDSGTSGPPVAGDGTQIWKITHNGVDTHAIHVHLFNVQLINRVGWDGMVKPPFPNELGWKETVRMNPLEDAIIALRPVNQTLPFKIPNSVRPFDVTMPVGSTTGFTDVDPNNNPVTVTNQLTNFGYEYVWHCHLLGHEENDMMRPLLFAAKPQAPSLLTAKGFTGPLRVVLTWTNNSLTASGNTLQRAVDPGFTTSLSNFSLGATVTTYTDSTVLKNTVYYYRVLAANAVGSTVPGYPTATSFSTPSGTVAAGPPAAPSLLTATQPTTTIVLNWTDNAPSSPSPPSFVAETGFTVQRSTGSATGPWTNIANLPAHAGTGPMNYSDTTAVTGKTYWYRVLANNIFGSSASNVPAKITKK